MYQGLVKELLDSSATANYLWPDRVYPLVIPQKVRGGATTMPCVVYSGRDVDRQVTYCGTARLVRSAYTLDCYATTYDTARDLAAAVRTALIDFRGMLGGMIDVRAASLETEFDVNDFEPGLFRVSQSWSFWHVE